MYICFEKIVQHQPPLKRMITTTEKVQLKVVPDTSKNTLKVNYHNLKKAALVLRALNHKLRQQILTLIEAEDKITVTEIYIRLRLEQSVASQHLAILRRAGIVSTQRDGKFIYYTVNYARIDQITDVTESLVA